MQSTRAIAADQSLGARSFDRAQTRDRVFFGGTVSILVAVVLAGFSRTYYFNSFAVSPFPLTALLYVHGAVFSAWMVMLIVQTTLIARRRVSWHRRMGVGGCVLAAAMVALGIAVAITRTSAGLMLDRGVPSLVFLAVPVIGMVVFAMLFAAAVHQRSHAAAHKRLMILATLEIATAAVSRLPVVEAWGPVGFFGVTDLFVLALVAYDLYTVKRVQAATLWGGLFLVLSQPLRLVVGGSAAWLSFASWLTGS